MGNISAGKTTLCKLIEKKWSYDFYREEVDELVLNYYYGDRKEHAYNTQVFFLSSRFRNWWHMTISPRSSITDRIKEEDIYIFTEKNYRDQFLSKREKMILIHQYDAMKLKIPEPDLVIFPHTEVDELKVRIEKRLIQEGKVRESERGLLSDQDTYLEDLNRLYEEFFSPLRWQQTQNRKRGMESGRRWRRDPLRQRGCGALANNYSEST